MKKEAVKTLIITLLYCFEGFINGNKSFMALIITFACIFGRSLLGNGKSNTEG